MTDQNSLARITDWVEAEDDLSLDEQGNILLAEEMLFEVDVDDERLLLTHRSLEPAADDQRIAELRSRLPGRATTMTGAVEQDDEGARVILSNRVFLDGLTHQTFSTALRDLVGAVDALSGEAPPEREAAEAVSEPEESATEPAEPEPTREITPAWVATHAVPAGGLSARPEPNPDIPATATLEARVRLSIAERRGDWAKVVGSNGWTGWVDARRLEELARSEPGATPPVARTPSTSPQPLILAGALFTAASALLPWLDDGRNAMELTLKFLWDVEAQGTPYLGWALFALGALALGASFLQRPLRPAVLVGIVTIAVAVAFVAQLYRVLSDVGGGFQDLKDVIGWAPAVALGGGILTVVGATR